MPLYFAPGSINAKVMTWIDAYAWRFISSHAFRVDLERRTYSLFGELHIPQRKISMGVPGTLGSPQGSCPCPGVIGHQFYVISSPTDIVRLNLEGWPTWAFQPATGVRDMKLRDGVVWALLQNDTLQLLDAETGDPLPSIPVTLTGKHLLVGDGHFYGVSIGYYSQAEVSRYDLQGNLEFTASVPLGSNGRVTDAVLDDLGRVWITYTEDNLEGAPILGLLTGVDTNGTTLGTWTYGASMNSLAYDGGRLFITGRATADLTNTYLLAVDLVALDLQVGLGTDIDSRELMVWPNPAKDELYMSFNGDVMAIDLLDATGRTVRSWSGEGSMATGKLDVSGLAPGQYILRAEQASGVSIASVILQ